MPCEDLECDLLMFKKVSRLRLLSKLKESMLFNLLFKEVVFWIWGWVLWHQKLEPPHATKLSTHIPKSSVILSPKFSHPKNPRSQ